MDIKEIRNNIDKTDEEITRLLVRRMQLTGEVAKFKQKTGKAVHDGLREREVVENVMNVAGEPYARYMNIIYNTIMDTSKSYQYSLLDSTGGSTEDAAENSTDGSTGNVVINCTHGSTEDVAGDIYPGISEKTAGGISGKIMNAIGRMPEMFPASATVACQGIPGAYSEAAALHMFKSPQIMYFNSFEKVCDAVEKGLCRYGILPVENSNYGSIGITYDLMREHDFHIVRGTRHKVNHKLLAKPGTKLSDIKRIYSHEQALGQCHEFLDSLDDVAVMGTVNTAVAARDVAESERRDVAAISSADCADLYGLEIIADDIQISDHNYTRFICISKDLEIYPGDNKISLILKVAHKPMSLYHTLGKMSTLGINICKLESRPIPGSDFEFCFYFDLEATIADREVRTVLSELEKDLDYFVFLGAYQEV